MSYASTSFDDTVDEDAGRRCYVFLQNIHKCSNGDFCPKYHTYPKDDGVMCSQYKIGKCKRSREECWYKHTSFQSKSKATDDNEKSYNVQPVGELIEELRQKTRKNTVKPKNQNLNEIRVKKAEESKIPNFNGKKGKKSKN